MTVLHLGNIPMEAQTWHIVLKETKLYYMG